MSTRSIIRIHLQMLGDFNADQVYHVENPNSPAVVYTQVVIGGSYQPVVNPMPIDGTIMNGIIVVPPRDNIHRYNIILEGNQGPDNATIVYHPTAPSVLSMVEIIRGPMLISHNGPAGFKIPFTFIWY